MGRAGGLLPVLVLAGATLVFYWELLLPTRILADYDVWTYFYPLRSYAAQAIQSGRFPLWNPDTFLGSPFFANPQTAVLYPGTVLFYLLPIPYAYSLSVIAHVFLLGLFTYAFLRWSLGIGLVGTLVGASVFAFGGPVSAQVGHLNQLSATAWAPAILWCADRAYQGRSLRWAVGGGAALAVQLLAGHGQISYMTAWAVAVLLLWRVVEDTLGERLSWPILGRALRWPRLVRARSPQGGQDERAHGEPVGNRGGGPAAGGPGVRVHLVRVFRPALRGLGVAAIVAAVGGGLAAVQLLPTLELARESVRSGGLSYEEASAFSLPPVLLARSLLPGYWANPLSEFLGYVGLVPFFFAALGLAFGSRGTAAFAGALAVSGILLALGRANPLYPLLYEAVPGLDLFRVPARWLLVYSLGAAILTALGVEWALTRPVRRGSPWRAMGLALLAAAATGAGAMTLVGTSGRIVSLWVVGAVVAALLAGAALRWAPRFVAILLVVGSFVDLRLAALDLPQRHAVPAEAADGSREVPQYLAQNLKGRLLSVAPTEYEVPDYAELATRHPGLDPAALFAFKTVLKLDEVMSPNVPLRYGLATMDGYDGGVLPLRRYLDVASLLVPWTELRPDGMLRTRLVAVPEEPLLRLVNVQGVIANQVKDVELGGWRFDVATARTLCQGHTLRVPLATPVRAKEIALLSSTAGPLGPSEGPTMALLFSDGSSETVLLRAGEHLFPESQPGPVSAPQPVAGGPPSERFDSVAPVPVGGGVALVAVEWTWPGASRACSRREESQLTFPSRQGALPAWHLRAATVVAEDGAREQLVLDPGLRRTRFPVLKVYEREAQPTPLLTGLRPMAQILDDAAALEALKTDPSFSEGARVVIAPEAGASPGVGTGEGAFRRAEGAPERLAYQRVEGRGSGYLVVDDAWFPGWRAQVDESEAVVLRANVLFKAVWVPAGASQVVFTYDPASLRWGAALSLLAGLLALGLTLSSKFKVQGRE